MKNEKLDRLIRSNRINVAIENEGITKSKNLFTGVYTSNLFKRLSARLTEIFASKSNVHGFALTNTFDRKILEWANRETYMAIGDVSVYAPVGLSVSYMEYITALENALPQLIKLDSELLSPTAKIVGTYLNTPEKLISISGIKITPKETFVPIEASIEPITACFDSTNKSDTIPYRQAFRRNAEIDDVTQRVLQLQDNLARIDIKAIKKRVKGIFDSAEALSELISDSNDSDTMETINVSKKVTQQLSDILYDCARWVEFYALYQYKVVVLSEALEDTGKKLKKLSK